MKTHRKHIETSGQKERMLSAGFFKEMFFEIWRIPCALCTARAFRCLSFGYSDAQNVIN